MRSHSHQSGNYPKRSASQTSSTTISSLNTQNSDEKKTRRISNPISSKLFRSGSKSPEIDIPKRKHSHTQSLDSQFTPQSNLNMDYFAQRDGSTSPVQMSSGPSSPQSPKPDFSKGETTPTQKNNDDYRRYSGTVNHYGRHSNDWLFGGFSVRDTVRDGIEKLRHHDKES
ncbi:hypothetical protein N7454_008775 [Penicillium verhagenii]|nr:hypothetical protein N7454_008775 [Penicillium verhagenii]